MCFYWIIFFFYVLLLNNLHQIQGCCHNLCTNSKQIVVRQLLSRDNFLRLAVNGISAQKCFKIQ